jgi:L-threonylcarbamoyladenylate synthase
VVRVLRVDPRAPDPASIAEAARTLAQGGLVAFPTETVYGLGARGLHGEDVARIFAAKGRPPSHPLILHVDGAEMAERLASRWPTAAARLAEAFWPGPLTLVVPRSDSVPGVVSGGLATVGVRAPRHPVALALIRAAGEPLAAPSANAHTHVSPTTAAHVVRSLGDAVDLVLDAGPTAHGIESTVLDLGSDPPRVLRPGAVTLADLRRVMPGVFYEAASVAGDLPRASPGLAAKHYAPRARVTIASAAELAAAPPFADGEGAIVVWSEPARTAAERANAAVVIVLPADAEGYARGLFAALHEAEEAKVERIVIERVPDEPAWWAIADRVRRAAEPS